MNKLLKLDKLEGHHSRIYANPALNFVYFIIENRVPRTLLEWIIDDKIDKRQNL